MARPEPPLGLLAELTHRCPLQCPYCSNPLALVPGREELETGAWLSAFEEAGALGVLQVHLSGGEPAARRDLETLVAGARAAGLYTNLITSGLLLDEARLRRLAEAGLDHLQLSIQSSEAEEGDRIAGHQGAHRRKLALAAAVRAAGLPLTLNAVLHRQNLHRLPALIELALSLGAGRLELAHAQYHGWALRNRAALLPGREEVEAAGRLVEAASARLRGRLRIDYVVPDYHAERPKACMGGWGRQFLAITPDGTILPCHAAQSIPGLRFPTLGREGLRGAWEESEAFRRFRGTGWMAEPCRSCERRELDWGGCRCQALALAGDAAAADPACALSPHHAAMTALAEREAAGPAPDFAYRRPQPSLRNSESRAFSARR